MKRDFVNTWEWGLDRYMDQAESVGDVSRYLHCSGQFAVEPDPGSELGIKVLHPGDIRGQLQAALANIDALLDKTGLSRENVISLRFFTTDVDGFLANYDVYVDWISEVGTRPPQSLRGIERLIHPDLMIEIEMLAGE